MYIVHFAHFTALAERREEKCLNTDIHAYTQRCFTGYRGYHVYKQKLKLCPQPVTSFTQSSFGYVFFHSFYKPHRLTLHCTEVFLQTCLHTDRSCDTHTNETSLHALVFTHRRLYTHCWAAWSLPAHQAKVPYVVVWLMHMVLGPRS